LFFYENLIEFVMLINSKNKSRYIIILVRCGVHHGVHLTLLMEITTAPIDILPARVISITL